MWTISAADTTYRITVHRYNPPHVGAKKAQNHHQFSELIRSLAQGEWWDSKLPGFGIRVGKHARTFVLKKDNRRIKIGRYGSITLQDARRRALALKAAGPQTVDPHITFGEAVDLFLATHCQTYRPGSMRQARHLLRKLDLLRGKKLAAVTTHDLRSAR